MPKLKLFISHSSRLDDLPHEYTDEDANWRLLRETCEELKGRYPDTIRLLVDQDGLVPGDDWNKELNLWLAECQAAIILVSKRALERSDWVAKEAAILGWRRVLDPSFLLIPVTLEGESRPADLADGFWGSLDLNRVQCVHAPRQAQAIVDGLAPRLGDPEALAGRCALTPLDQLRGAVAKLLSESATVASLEAALDDLDSGDTDLDFPLSDRDRCAHQLARRLLQTAVDDVWGCFDAFRKILCHAVPPLEFEQANWLFRLIRALWVHPGAAAFLPTAVGGQPALALCGAYVNLANLSLNCSAFTLERYLERAWSWPEARPRVVSLTRLDAPGEQVRALIADQILPGHPSPESEGARRALNRETIVLFIPALADDGGAPDPRSLKTLSELAKGYSKLALVFACCDPADALPDGMRAVVPPLEPAAEDEAYSAECAETTYLRQHYGRHP